MPSKSLVVAIGHRAYHLVLGCSGGPVADCFAPLPLYAERDGCPNETLLGEMTCGRFIPLSDPPADAWWARWILWCHVHIPDCSDRRFLPGESLVCVASDAMQSWLTSTHDVPEERREFFQNPTRSFILKHLKGKRLHRQLILSMWRQTELQAADVLQSVGTGATIWSNSPYSLGSACTLRHPDRLPLPCIYDYEGYRLWACKVGVQAPEKMKVIPASTSMSVPHTLWPREKERKVSIIGFQPSKLLDPVRAILQLLRANSDKIFLYRVHQPLGLSLRRAVIPRDACVVLPKATYNSTAAIWANLLGDGRQVVRWQQSRVQWPKTAATSMWLHNASLLEPKLLLDILQTIVPMSKGPVYLDIAHKQYPFGHVMWWWPLWNALCCSKHVKLIESPRADVPTGGRTPSRHIQHILWDGRTGVPVRRLKEKLHKGVVGKDDEESVHVWVHHTVDHLSKGDVCRLTLRPGSDGLMFCRILQNGAEEAFPTMPRAQVLKLVESGVLKCIGHWIPMRREGNSERPVPDLGHDVAPMDETNVVVMRSGYSDLQANYPLGAKEWALQYWGPIDPPPDQIWADLVEYELG